MRQSFRKTLGGGATADLTLQNSEAKRVDSQNQDVRVSAKARNTKSAKNTSARQKSHEISKQSRVFRPLIASALATALGASVAVANPVFKSNGSDVTSQFDTQLKWSPVGNLLQSDVQNINFSFADPHLSFAKQDNNLNVTLSYRSLSIESDKGLQMGDGNGTMSINWVSSYQGTRSFTLELSKATGTSFRGDINFINGASSQEETQFIGNFGGNLDGNIRSVTPYGSNTTFNFKGETAIITGGITLNNNAAMHPDAKKSVLIVNANSLTIGKGIFMASTTYNVSNSDPITWNAPKATFNLSGDNVINKSDDGNALDIQNSAIFFNLTGQSSLGLNGNILLRNNDNTALSIMGKESSLTINGNVGGIQVLNKHLIDINVKSLKITGDLINPSSNSTAYTNITLNGGDSVIGGNVDTLNSPKANFTLNNNTTLTLKGTTNNISTLTLSGVSTLIVGKGATLTVNNIASNSAISPAPTPADTKLNLTVSSDNISNNKVIKLGSAKQTSVTNQVAKDGTISVIYQKGVSLESLKKKDVVTVAHYGTNGTNPIIDFNKTTTEIQGLEEFTTTFSTTMSTDSTTYFIKDITSTLSNEGRALTDSIPVGIIDLYLANFNSLNKRMGELRDNNHSQGAWGRIFNGAQKDNFADSRMNFTTIQAGYDYGFGLGEGATNYLGFAISYGFSSSTLSASNQTAKSSLIEGAVYNSYVQDSGWFNDTILKFGYLDNEISGNGMSFKGKGSFTFNVSNEFGYRIKLGQADEWYIDPQAELGFGYVNGDEFSTTGLNSFGIEFNSLFVIKSRLGATFGYDFKNFTQEDLKAKLYLGLFSEMDFFKGREQIRAKGISTHNLSSALNSDARAVLNIGTNLEVKDNTRIYMDFESSFGGKITTDYKINAGVRYSFGEKMDYSDLKDIKPLQTKSAPMKLKEEASTQPAQTESQVSEEKTNKVETANQEQTSEVTSNQQTDEAK